MGTSTMNADTTLVCISDHFTSMALMYLANANAVANLANSDGCSLKKPRSIHDLPPCEVTAMKSVTTSSASTTP